MKIWYLKVRMKTLTDCVRAATAAAKTLCISCSWKCMAKFRKSIKSNDFGFQSTFLLVLEHFKLNGFEYMAKFAEDDLTINTAID